MYFSRNTRSSPKAAAASRFADSSAAPNSAGAATLRMPLPPPPAIALINTGQPMAAASRGESGFALVLAQISGRGRHAGPLHQPLGRVLQPHGANRGGRRADPNQAGRDHRLGEVGVLGEEAVAWMYGLSARSPRGVQDLGLRQIAVARRGRPDGDRSSASRTYGASASASE